MKIDVKFLEGQNLEASFKEFKVVSDQSKVVGGQENAPEPFDYFLSSMALCAGFYVRAFCGKRDIATDGIKISQVDTKDETNKYKRRIEINIELPSNFPDKYRQSVKLAAEQCAVKKAIEAAPEFDVIVK
ncbi:MAG: OsmC family protein [Bacteriovoracaceae bacterium]|nr:OsmC family protein [Bacteriovoracaceae bacterium]